MILPGNAVKARYAAVSLLSMLIAVGTAAACNAPPMPDPPAATSSSSTGGFQLDKGVTELADACDDGLDNDGNMLVDEECYCKPGTRQFCYPAAVANEVGQCRLGQQTCGDIQDDFNLGFWGECVGARLPTEEICGNDIDEDCDGFDEECPKPTDCEPGVLETCYGGPSGTVDVGLCKAGKRFCTEFEEWTECLYEVRPMAEICGNGIDEDCNGEDQKCEPPLCTTGTTQGCYDGPDGTLNVGICAAGEQTCLANGEWSECSGAKHPAMEVCGNNVDEDCDGTADSC